MVTEYSCDKCNKIFKQKGDYIKHINKKYPCVSLDELKNTGLKNEDVQLSRLEQLFNRMREILRDNESITGKDALDVISDFLLLRLLKPLLVKNEDNPNAPYIDMMEMNYMTDNDAQTYKKYIYWDNLVDKVKKIQNNVDKDELDNIVKNGLFKGVLRLHPTTSEIFGEKAFVIKKTVTIIAIIKEIQKFDESGNFDNIDVDIKGKAYELSIQKEASTNKDFGQFFTPRWIVKYMVEQLNPKVNEDGTYDKIMDPACGTAGFLTEYYKFVRKKAAFEDILINPNIQNYVYGYEIVAKTRELAIINMLLNSGMYNYNIKQDDFLEKSVDYLKNKFKGHILMNPPFSMDKDYDKLCTNDDYKTIFPVKTSSGTFLFLEACLNIMDNGYKCCVISPNGKEIFGKNKEYVNIRKNIMENANVYKIVYLPSQSFKPYTCVETLIIFFEKGNKTKETIFYNLTKNKNDTYIEQIIKVVKYDTIKNKNYSWNIKDYIDLNIGRENFINEVFFPTVCEFKNGRQLAKSNFINGKYLVIGGGQQPTGVHNEYNREENTILCSSSGAYAGFISRYKKKIWASDCFSIHSKNPQLISEDYIYYYLKYIQDKIYELQNGSAQPHVYPKTFETIKISVPPFSIQQKIVDELNAFYDTIKALNKSLDNIKQIKKTQFSNIISNKKVSKKKLEEITTINIGGTPSRKIPVYFEGTNKWVQISDMNTKYISDTKEKITDDGVNNSNVKLIKKGNILLSFKLSIGKIAFADDTMYCNEAIAFFEGNDEVSTKYLYTYFENTNITGGSSGCIGGGSLNKEKLNNLVISYPLLEDQEKIIKEMEELDVFEEQTKKLIQNLNKQAKETLERHLNSCKKQENPIKQYNEIMKKLGKPEIIDDDNTEELENKFASLEADFESLTGNNLSELLKESEDDTYQDEPNDNEPTSDNDEEYNKTITIKPKQKKAEEKDIFDE